MPLGERPEAGDEANRVCAPQSARPPQEPRTTRVGTSSCDSTGSSRIMRRRLSTSIPAAFSVSPQALAAVQGDMGVVPQLTGDDYVPFAELGLERQGARGADHHDAAAKALLRRADDAHAGRAKATAELGGELGQSGGRTEASDLRTACSSSTSSAGTADDSATSAAATTLRLTVDLRNAIGGDP